MGTYFDLQYLVMSLPILLSYVHITIWITVVSILAGVAIGCAVALIRINRLYLLEKICIVYVSFMRGTPFLVQLFLIYFGLPELLQKFNLPVGRDVPALLYVCIIFSLHVGACGAEVMRSAILAVPKGQMEAGYSIGMNTAQAYRRILLPQAFTLAIAPLGNIVISTVKGTSLVFNVGVVDMMRKADLMGAYSQRSLELYIDLAIIYVLLVVIISQAVKRLEKYTNRGVRLAKG